MPSTKPTAALIAANMITEINHLHADILAAARTSLDKGIRLGELLAQVRDSLRHGEWLPWLRANVQFSERTARNYLRCFENRERLKSATVADLSGAYALLSEHNPPDNLTGDFPTAEELAGDISSEGEQRFLWCCAKTKETLNHFGARLKSTTEMDEVVQIKERTDGIMDYWREVGICTQTCLGECLIALEESRERSAKAHI